MLNVAQRAARVVAVFVSVFLFALIFLSGCAGVASRSVPQAPASSVSVSVSPTASSIQVSKTQDFTAAVANDSQNKGVTWALSGTGCNGAACGTLSATSSASGAAVAYTAPASAPATVTLSATSVTDSAKSAAAAITVTMQPVIAVTVSPSTANVQAGAGKQSFTATVQNDSQNKGVTWSLSGAGCTGAACGSLSATSSASGAAITYIAPANAPTPSTVALHATSVADGAKSAAAAITVTTQPAVAVTVSPTTANVQAGAGTKNFTAIVQNDSQNKGVAWALSGAGCTGAACGSLSATASASGTTITYTAPATAPTPATVTLTAISVSDGTKSAKATITVVAPSIGIGVTLTPKRGGLTVSQSLNFTSTIANDVGSAGVTWSATAGSFSSQSPTSAVYVAPATPGVITVTATSNADVTKSASATIGVTDLAGVVTYHNDLSRDGVNSQEYALTTANVVTATFGKLFSCTIDSPAYAQPLWVANLTIGGGTHNVIFAASSRDTVYAFDADAHPCVTYWSKQLMAAGETFLNNNDVGTTDILTDVGIVGTPVIDPSTNTLYVVAKTKNQGTSCTPSSSCHQRLHALSLLDGSEKLGGPVDLTSSITVPGTGDGSSGGNLPFDPLRENQRPGLALVNGIVYVSWASHGDNGPYHGWVMGFDKTTLTRVAIYNDSPNGRQAGIWMAGGAPASDGSNLYLLTGNGDFDGTKDFGDSFLKLNTSSGLSLADWFTPFDESSLDGGDQDVGSGGAAVLVDLPASPVPHLLIGGGKAGSGNSGQLYVLNRDSMGHNQSGSNGQIVQEFPLGNSIFATAAFWKNTLYLAGVGGPVKAFALNVATSKFDTSSTSRSSGSFGFPGATPSVSAGGTSNGIVWALDNSRYGTPCCSNGPAILHAYDAANLATELWNSSQGSGNTAGNAVKFTVPPSPTARFISAHDRRSMFSGFCPTKPDF
jgi:hypothetical protein